jgi:hypothetical protein
LGGAGPLDLGAGSARAELELTALTRRIPLTVSGLSLQASGFPVAVTATVPRRTYNLAPGHSVLIPVRLKWHRTSAGKSLLGGSNPSGGQLYLTGLVTSPYTPAIQNFYSDSNFAVGKLSGTVAPKIEATIPIGAETGIWLIAVVVVLALILAVGYLLARLGGQLVFTSVDRRIEALALPARPVFASPTDHLTGVGGRLVVLGSIFGQKMHIWLKPERRRWQHFRLAPNGRKMMTGVVVQHMDRSQAAVASQQAPARDTTAETGAG